MAKRRHNKSQHPKSLQELIKQKAELEFHELRIIEKALKSNSPQAYIEAQTYIKGLEERKNDNLRSFTFSPEQTYYTGQGYKYKPQGLNSQLLRNMANTPQIKAIINTRIEQASNFNNPTIDLQKPGWTISKRQGLFDDKEKELTDKEKREIEAIILFLESGGNNSKWDFEGWETFTRKLYEDSWAIDQGVFEVAVDRIARPTNFEVYDGATFYLAEHNIKDDKDREKLEAYMINGYLPRYVQVFASRVYREYYPWELCFGVRNASTSIRLNGYGLSENEVLIQVITWMLNSNQYNGNFFQQGSNPKGILNFKDNVDPSQLESFKQAWGNTLSGVRNCVSENTFIYTDKGGITIGEMFEKDSSEKSIKIWDGEEFNKAKVFKTEYKRLNRMYLNNGTSIESSPEHRFKVIAKDGHPVWKERKDIIVGDYVLTNKNSVSIESKLKYKDKLVESDLFEVMGWFIGDGWMGMDLPKKRRLQLYYHHDKEVDISERHLAILKKYNINAYIKKDYLKDPEKTRLKYGFKTISPYHLKIYINDIDLYKFLFSIGFKPSGIGKEIPSFLFKEYSINKNSFLRGFLSADGNNSTGRAVQMTIVDDLLREQTKMLLLSEGINCGNHEGKKRAHSFGVSYDGYRLLIKDVELYFEKIGFLQEHKQAINLKVRKAYVKESISPYTARVIVEEILKKEYKDKELTGKWTLSKRNRDDLNRFMRGGRSMTRQLVESYANRTDVKLPEFFGNYNFEKVIKLEETGIKIPMYDIEVLDDKHQFIANGILTHNSHKLAAISGGNLEWLNMQLTNRDMEFSKWAEFLTVLSCTVFRIDPTEVGFNLEGGKGMFGQDGQKERLAHSKEKGLEPFLKFWQRKFTKYLVGPISDGKYEFKFTGLEPDDEQANLDRDVIILNNGGMSVQDFFLKYSDKELDFDKDILLNQVLLQYKQMEQNGTEEANAAVDEEAGESFDNPYEEFENKGESDPFNKALNTYLDKFVDESKNLK